MSYNVRMLYRGLSYCLVFSVLLWRRYLSLDLHIYNTLGHQLLFDFVFLKGKKKGLYYLTSLCSANIHIYIFYSNLKSYNLCTFCFFSYLLCSFWLIAYLVQCAAYCLVALIGNEGLRYCLKSKQAIQFLKDERFLPHFRL